MGAHRRGSGKARVLPPIMSGGHATTPRMKGAALPRPPQGLRRPRDRSSALQRLHKEGWRAGAEGGLMAAGDGTGERPLNGLVGLGDREWDRATAGKGGPPPNAAGEAGAGTSGAGEGGPATAGARTGTAGGVGRPTSGGGVGGGTTVGDDCSVDSAWEESNWALRRLAAASSSRGGGDSRRPPASVFIREARAAASGVPR